MVVELVIRATKLIKEGAILLGAITNIANTASTWIGNTCSARYSLQRSEMQYDTKDKSVRRDLEKAAEVATPYFCRVEDLFQYGREEKFREVIAGLKAEECQLCCERRFLIFWRYYSRAVPAPKYGPLSTFLDQLKRFLEQTNELYQKFTEAIEIPDTSSTEAAEECNYKALEAQKNRSSTKKKGIVRGLGVAAVAAFLTVCLGSQFGLSTGAAIAGGCVAMVATGAGAAKVTYNIIRDLQNLERVFKKLSSKFDGLACRASDMSTSALRVKNTLETLAMSVNDVEHCQRKSVNNGEHSRENLDSLCTSLDRLHDKFRESLRVVSKCRATMVQHVQFKPK